MAGNDHGMTGMQMLIAAEPVAGGGGTNFRTLPQMRGAPAPWVEFTEERAEGSKYPTDITVGDEGAEGDLSSGVCWGTLPFMFDSLLHATTPVGGAGGSYERIWLPQAFTPDIIRTFEIDKGNGLLNWKWVYAYWNALTLTFSRKVSTQSGTVRAWPVDFMHAMPATPTVIEGLLMNSRNSDLFYSTVGLDDLNTNPIQILRGFNFEWGVADRFGEYAPMNSTIRGYGGILEGDSKPTVNLRLGKQLNGTTPWSATTVYTIGQVRTRVTGTWPNNLVFRAATAGTSGGTEPTWPATAGGTVVDGTVTWEAIPLDYGDPLSYDVMRKGAYRFFRLQNRGPVISGAITYLLQVDVSVKISDAPGDDTEGPLLVNSWKTTIVPSQETGTLAGAPMKVRLVNKVAAV